MRRSEFHDAAELRVCGLLGEEKDARAPYWATTRALDRADDVQNGAAALARRRRHQPPNTTIPLAAHRTERIFFVPGPTTKKIDTSVQR